TGRCVMVAKEIFEQLKNLDSANPRLASQTRLELTRVMENDLIPVLGASELAGMVDRRLEDLAPFFRLYRQSQNLQERACLAALGQEPPFNNEIPANHGV